MFKLSMDVGSALSGSWSLLRARKVGWANVWKTQGGAVGSVTNIYSLDKTILVNELTAKMNILDFSS